MASIPPNKLAEDLKGVARDVALELRLPWRLADLRKKALEIYRSPGTNSGRPSEQAHQTELRRIRAEVKKFGRVSLDPLPPGVKKPRPEAMDMALETFSLEQWIVPIDTVGQLEAEALLSYIRRDTGKLQQRLGARELERIEGRAIMRDTHLWLRENRSTLVPISDVYWAVALRDLALEANTQGMGRPAKGLSMAERARAPYIARRLRKQDQQTGREMKVSRYEAKKWQERSEELPFEQYVADIGAGDEEKRGAALIDYWIMLRNTSAFKEYMRKRDQRGQ